MVLEASGMIKKFAYVKATAETDTIMDCFVRCAEVTVDVSAEDLVQLIYW